MPSRRYTLTRLLPGTWCEDFETRNFQFEPGHMHPTVAHPGAPGQPESRGFIAFLSLATYLRIATIAIVAQQDSLVFLGYRDAMV